MMATGGAYHDLVCWNAHRCRTHTYIHTHTQTTGLLYGVMMATGGAYHDLVLWNAHRTYGVVQYSHVTANWRQEWRAPDGFQRVHLFTKIDMPGLRVDGPVAESVAANVLDHY